MTFARICRLAVVACLLAFPSPAWAERKGMVAIWSPPDDHLAVRLRAELVASGFDVISALTPPDVSRASIEQTGRELHATAVLRFFPGTGEVHFWVIGPTGKATLREILQAQAEGDEDILVRRAAELVRANAEEHGHADDPVDASRSAPTAVAAPTKATTAASDTKTTFAATEFSVGIGPAVLASAGGASASVGALLSGEWRAFEHVGLEAFAMAPISAARIEDVEGRVNLRTYMLGGGARLYVTGRDARWRPNVGAGAGLGWTLFDAAALSPFESRSTDRLALVGYASVGIGFALRKHFVISADARGGVANPEMEIRFARRGVATWGFPWLLGSVSGMISW